MGCWELLGFVGLTSYCWELLLLLVQSIFFFWSLPTASHSRVLCMDGMLGVVVVGIIDFFFLLVPTAQPFVCTLHGRDAGSCCWKLLLGVVVVGIIDFFLGSVPIAQPFVCTLQGWDAGSCCWFLGQCLLPSHLCLVLASICSLEHHLLHSPNFVPLDFTFN